MTDPNGAPVAEQTPAPEAQPAEQPTAAPGAAPARPDFIPEKFWDAEKGAPRLEDMAKSYSELERFRMGRTERVPEDYALPKAFEGYADQIQEDALKAVKELASGEGLSQQGFDNLMRALYGDPSGHVEELQQAYGDKLDETLEACRLFARTIGEHESVVRQLTSTAAGVKFLNDLRMKSAEAPLPGQPGQGAPKLTEVELRSKMNDPRYWRDKDPALIAEVERGFQQLYPGSQRTAAVNPGDQVGSAA